MRKLSILLLFLLAIGLGAWADNVTLSVDTEIPVGTAGHWYVNMPARTTDRMTLSVDDLTACGYTFKVYDDSGKDGNYSVNCSGRLAITVPEGYAFLVTGTLWTQHSTSEYLIFIKGDTYPYIGGKWYSDTDGEPKTVGPVTCDGNIMSLLFNSNATGTQYAGFDLTVTVVDVNTDYTVSISNPAHGTLAVDKATAKLGETVTVTPTPETDFFTTEVSYTVGTTKYVINPVNNVYSFTMPAYDVSVGAVFMDDVMVFWGGADVDGSEEHPYVISNQAGWDLLVTKSTTSDYTNGKYFELAADISGVTQSVLFFGGHLDGKGHKITLEMGMDGIGLIDLSYYGCTISNLTVEGSIENPAAIVGGFIARSAMINNTITLTDCRSSVTITSTYSGTDHYCGGFVGKAVNVECVRCVFDGAFVSSTAFGFSGLVGSCLQLSVTDCAVVFGSATSLTYQNGANFSFANYSQITKQGHNFYFNKGYIFHILSNDITPVYPLTFTEPAAAVRTGGTAIGNGAGTAYADGFTYNGDEYYAADATVTLSAPVGVSITAAQYNDGANHAATINTDGTASFTMPATATTATATGFAAQYIDAEGTEQTCDPVNLLLSSDAPVYKEEGWYAVTGEVTLRQGLVFSGAAHLILCDGATLNVKGKINDVDVKTAVEATDLSVYGQALGTGTLNADIGAKAIQDITLSLYAIKATGSLVFCGGQVNAHAIALASTTQGGFNCYGIYTVGSVNLIRGSLNVSTEKEIVPFGSVFVPTSATLYDITAAAVLLDWRCPTDRICLTAPGFMSSLSPVSVAEGKALWNGAEVLSGTIYNGGTDRSRFNGKTLEPCIPREVAGYGTGNDKWVLISSPVSGSIAPTAVVSLVGTQISTDPVLYDYDLYRFNQSAANEWENYHQHNTTENPFLLENSQGYLYATKEDKTLVFTGNFNAVTEPVEVPLAYSTDNPDEQMRGWNLVGNPFTVAAYADRSFYTMNDEGTGLIPNAITDYQNTTIAPCTGIVVQATTTGEHVTFSTTAPEVPEPVEGPVRNSDALLRVGVSTGSTTLVLDNAIVSFSEGSQLGKFYFGTQDANIYIPQGGKDYAIAFAEEKAGEMPLNFKANKNGTYTLSFTTDVISSAAKKSLFTYLHLIDNLTGADIDLLTPPACGHPLLEGEVQPASSYIFSAKTTDYESRFKLVFSTEGDGPSTGSGTFAYIDADGNIIVNAGPSTGSGTSILQIVDIMSRIMMQEENATRISTSGMTPSVYVLRLINVEKVRTQKIVVR